MSEACPHCKREITAALLQRTEGCNHCWHHRGTWTDTAGTHQSRSCCHCGVFETISALPLTSTPGNTTWIQAPKHGPHVPPEVVRW